MKKCELCDGVAYADAQMVRRGPWMYVCNSHLLTRKIDTLPMTKLVAPKTGVTSTNEKCGGRLVEGNMCSSVITIACENCSEERRMEPDSDTYVCTGCGATVEYDVMEEQVGY